MLCHPPLCSPASARRALPLGAAIIGAALLAGCETPVSLKETRRPLPAPVVVAQSPVASTSLPPMSQPAPQPVPTSPPPAQALPVPSTPGAAVPTAPAGGEIHNALYTEQQWLKSWYGGTPVVIGMAGDGAVRVEVPLAFCFDDGQALVKAPLARVLDHVATSARRVNGRLAIETPSDADAANPQRLALDRATAVRQHLVARGVPATRVNEVPLSRGSAVIVQLAAPQP